ncbi:hypothetical protein PM8797T_31785 [Gimesia maris DSM 8797]|nr:hypothetical protein PM8797T_31785 [Gimesia maris DSM 8797]
MNLTGFSYQMKAFSLLRIRTYLRVTIPSTLRKKRKFVRVTLIESGFV